MELRWVSLDEAHEAVLLGRVANSITVVAVLTAVAKRNAGWQHLLVGNAPWPQLEWRNATA
jgi:ADP-ribose pyrophosphatase